MIFSAKLFYKKWLTAFILSTPLFASSSDSAWLKDYQKNGGVFKPETHTVYPNVVMKPSGFVVASISMLYKTVGSTRNPLDWSDIQPKLVNKNTTQSEAMAQYKEYAHFAGNFLFFHLFAVPKVLLGFSDEDRAMIASKWGIETHHIPKDGDYVELIYSTESRFGNPAVLHHKITVNHKKIAELGSLSAYLKHKGFTFTPPSVEFVFENNKIDFNSRRDKIQMFNYVFNFLANDYTYRLGNQTSANTNFKSDWKRIYNYTLGKHSPQFARAGVIASHKNYKNALSQSTSIHKFSFSKEGGVGGANIDDEEFYVLEDILIPKKDLDWKKAEVTIHRGDTYYKHERKWAGLTRKSLKGEAMSGDDVFMYLKARLNGFKDLSNGASSATVKENPIHQLPTKTYTFAFTKEGGLGGSDIDGKFYVDIEGLFVPHSDIKETKANTYELSIPDNGVYYRVKRSHSKGFIRGEKLIGAHAYNYLKANVTADSSAPPYLYKQTAGANPNIPGMPPVKSGSQQETKDCSVNISVYKFAFDGIVHEYFKPISIDGEKFYILDNILIPSNLWNWDGKIVITINKANTYYKVKRKSINNYQDITLVKGTAMSGEKVFNDLKGHLTHKGFEDRSCETSDSISAKQGNPSQGQQSQQSAQTLPKQQGNPSQGQQSQQSAQTLPEQQGNPSQGQQSQQSAQTLPEQQGNPSQGQQSQQSAQTLPEQPPTPQLNIQQQMEQMVQQQAQQIVQEIQQPQTDSVSTEQPQTESSSTEALNQQEAQEQTKKYVFSFVKKGKFGGQMFGIKFYADIEGLYVLYDDIRSLIGKPNTYKIQISNARVYYKVKHVTGKGYVRGEKLTGTQAFNYLKAKLSSKKEYSFKLY